MIRNHTTISKNEAETTLRQNVLDTMHRFGGFEPSGSSLTVFALNHGLLQYATPEMIAYCMDRKIFHVVVQSYHGTSLWLWTAQDAFADYAGPTIGVMWEGPKYPPFQHLSPEFPPPPGVSYDKGTDTFTTQEREG